MFTSDHGDTCGELERHNKGIPWEGSARIPFLIQAAGLIKPSTVIHEALGTVAFKPTLLDLLGVPIEEVYESRNAAMLFRTGKAPEDWENITYVRMGEPGRKKAGLVPFPATQIGAVAYRSAWFLQSCP